MLIVERFLSCDGKEGKRGVNCHDNFGVDCRNFSTKQQRLNAKKNGWHSDGVHDWCPFCWDAKNKKR